MIYTPGYRARTPIQASSQPRIVEKESGELYVLVRDDVMATGFLWISPVGALTSMIPVTPPQFEERFEWYVDPKNKAFAEEMAGGPVGPLTPFPDQDVAPEMPAPPKNRGGRPKGSKDKQPRKRPVRKVESAT